MQRQGQDWVRIFQDKPITKKPAEVRMGKGKGNPEGCVAPVTPGPLIFEIEGVPFDIAKEALRLAAQKLCSSALPMAVPCTDTSDGSIRRAKARAMR